MKRPTPYRPRVPDDLFAEIAELSDGSHKGVHELTLRYIREGIEKDRAVLQAEKHKVPGNWNFPFPDINLVNWANHYGFVVQKVIEEYARIANVEVHTINGYYHIDGSDIRELNSAFFGDNWEKAILLRELARMERK